MMLRRAESRLPNWSPALLKQESRVDLPANRRSTIWGWLLIMGMTALQFAWLAYRWFGAPAWFSSLPLPHKQFISLIETASLATSAIIWAGLWWRQQQRDSSQHGWGGFEPSLSNLIALEPRVFEQYVAWLFRRKGYTVEHRGGSGDLGVDLALVDSAGRRAIVQCKRYQSTVGAVVVRELYGTLVHEGVAHAFLVTTGEISDSARTWAAGKPLTLIDGHTLVAVANEMTRS